MASLKLPSLQPSTVIGIGALVATAAGWIAHVMTHDMSITAAAGLIAGGITHIILPDNSNEPDAVNKLVSDAVQAALMKNLAGALPGLLQDGLAVVQGLQHPTEEAQASHAMVSMATGAVVVPVAPAVTVAPAAGA